MQRRPSLLSPRSPCSSCHMRVFSLKEEMFLPSKVGVCKGGLGHSGIQLPTASVRGRPRPGSPAHPREEPPPWPPGSLAVLTKCVFRTLVPICSLWPFLTPSVNSKIPSILFNECSCPLSVVRNPGSPLGCCFPQPSQVEALLSCAPCMLVPEGGGHPPSLFCFQTIAPCPALMLTPADHHHLIALF